MKTIAKKFYKLFKSNPAGNFSAFGLNTERFNKCKVENIVILSEDDTEPSIITLLNHLLRISDL